MKHIEDIRSRLIGRTVVNVEYDRDSGEGSICKLTLDNSTAFRIHGNDLGAWVEDCEDTNGNHRFIISWITAYHNYCNSNLEKEYDFDVPLPEIKFCGNIIKIIAADKREFDLDITYLNDFEKKILSHPGGKEKFEYAIKAACDNGVPESWLNYFGEGMENIWLIKYGRG